MALRLHATPVRAGLVVIAAFSLLTASSTAAVAEAGVKRPRTWGDATILSVDGPVQLTVRTRGMRVGLRLAYVDAPAQGECGASEATALLTRLAKRRGGRVRYVLSSTRPDGDGRFAAFVGGRSADLLERSLAHDLVRSEWARPVGRTTVSEMDNAYLYVGGEPWGPRAPRGVWARCGGHLHLPATQVVPGHAPATWAVNADGITESVGPLTLDPVLAPGRTLTVDQLAAIAPVELSDHNGESCWARVPSLEIVAMAATPTAQTPCGTADVFAIASTGPGSAQTSRGVGVGASRAAMVGAFPRLAASWRREDRYLDLLPLHGRAAGPWAWQTLAAVNDDGKVTSFLTSTGTWPR